VPRDRWLHVLWHIKWSDSAEGQIEVFADTGGGLQRIAGYRGWTLKRGFAGQRVLVHPRVGIYRRTIPRDTRIYFSGFDVAASRGAAEAAAAF
jgi:hypothetical protein